MSANSILANEIDANQSWEAIGLDLAKDNVSFVGITSDGEIVRVDRVEYMTLLEWIFAVIGPRVLTDWDSAVLTGWDRDFRRAS